MNEGTRTGVLATALALSLVFNVFYIVGAWQGRQAPEVEQVVDSDPTDATTDVGQLAPDKLDESEDRVDRERRLADRIAERLGLSDEQHANFLELRMLIIEDEQAFDTAMQGIRAEIDAEWLDESPDRAHIMELRGQHDDLERKRKMAKFRYFDSFVKTLEDDQRKAFFEVVRSWQRDEMRRRFDRNHDGHLDDDEERQFNEACDRMRRGRPRGRRGDGGPPPNHDGQHDGVRDGRDGPGGPRDLNERPEKGGASTCEPVDSGRPLDAPVKNPELDPSEQARGPVFNA